MKPIIFGPYLSQKLFAYYKFVHHPGKLRVWTAFFRVLGCRLTFPYASAATITLNPADGVEATIMNAGFYEPEVWETLSQHLRPNDVVWDVGANIGGVSLRAALDPRVSEVHCFEPNPKTFRILSKNIEMNRPLKIIAHEIAMSDRIEQRSMSTGRWDNSGQASLQSEGPLSVKCSTIDEVIASGIKAPNVMKIDVEGWEKKLFQGAQKLFSETPPRAVLFETKYEERSPSLFDEEMASWFQKWGYRITHVRRPSGERDSNENFLLVKT